MTISSTANRASYSGNSVTTAFAFNPSFQMQSDLVVLLVDSSGNQTVQTLNSQYTISGATDPQGFYPNGGQINFSVAPATGTSVVIYRDPPLTQLVQHVDNGAVSAASLDNPTDKLTMAAQRDRDLINRSLRQPDGDTTNFTTVPPAATRANGGLGTYAGYDGTGQPTVFVPGPSQSAVSVAMSPVVQASTLPLARTAMGLGNVAVEVIGQGLEDDGAGNLRVKLDTTAGSTGILRSANGVKIDPAVLRGFLQGFETGAPGGANVLTIGPGACVDSANADSMVVTTTFTKSLASWAVGTGNGALDIGATGGAASTPYFVWVIMRPDTGVVDYLFSLSGTAPTMPASYTVKRLIGWFKTDGSKNILQFQQRGDEFIYGTSTPDVNVANLGTTRTAFTLTVPSGFQVNALFRAAMSNAAANIGLIFTSPDETDQATTANSDFVIPTAGNFTAGRYDVRTNTSQQINARASAASTSLQISTYGFKWARGRHN